MSVNEYKICKGCGKKLNASAKFCSGCGMECGSEDKLNIEEQKSGNSEKSMKCLACGAVLKPNTKFCTKCGIENPFDEHKEKDSADKKVQTTVPNQSGEILEKVKLAEKKQTDNRGFKRLEEAYIKLFGNAKNGNKVFIFLGVLALNFSPVVFSIVLMATKKQVSLFLQYFVSIILMFISIFFFMLFFTRSDESIPKQDETKQKTGFINKYMAILSSYLFLVITSLALGFLYKLWMNIEIPLLVGSRLVSIAVILCGTLLSIFIAYLMYTAFLMFVSTCKLGIYPQGLLIGYLYTFKKVFSRFFFNTSIIISAAITYLIIVILEPPLSSVFELLVPYAFLSNLISILTLSLLQAILLYLIIRAGLKNFEPDTAEKNIAERSFSLPVQKQSREAYQVIITGALFVLIILSDIFLIPKEPANIFSTFEKIVSAWTNTGEIMSYDSARLNLAAHNYRRAYSLLLSEEGYLKGLIAAKDSAQTQYLMDSESLFEESLKSDPGNLYAYLLKGYLLNYKGNYSDSINQFKLASNGGLEDANLYFGMYEDYAALKDSAKASVILNRIIQINLYSSTLRKTFDMPVEKLEETLKSTEITRSDLFAKLAYSAIEKLNNRNPKGMFEDIALMLKAQPENPTLQYLYGISALAYHEEQNNYPVADAAFDKFAEAYSSSPEVMTFRGEMYLALKEYDKALPLLKSVYDSQKEIPNIGEIYAYALLNSNKDEDAGKVAAEVLAVNSKNWIAKYILAVSELKLKKYANSLSVMSDLFTEMEKSYAELSAQSSDDLEVDPASIRSGMDHYLYAYALAYFLYTRDPLAMDALEKSSAAAASASETGILVKYIKAVTQWRDKDYASAEKNFLEIINVKPYLGYAEHMIANVYFEKTMRENTKNFEVAEEHYIKSLAIQPNHVTGWYSLATLYEKWTGHEKEALRAYRRVVDLNPYSDHTWDYYGNTYHSLLAVKRLEAVVSKN
jgi:tetratricopeptide (TPR) repeat protein